MLHQLISGIKQLPVVRPLLRRRYERHFRSDRGGNYWYGVYPTFAASAAAAPARVPLGYDQPATTALYDDYMHGVKLHDYPVLYWLRRALGPTSRVFDFGGHVGVLHYGYRPYLGPEHAPAWTVCDVPAVVEAGEKRARAAGESALTFTTRFADADGAADVVLASGVLQYIETPFAELVAGLRTPPAHIIVNKLPTNAEREYITLQNIGVAYCPYRIAARADLPASLARIGYELVDTWENSDERRTEFPYSGASAITWVGHYFRLR